MAEDNEGWLLQEIIHLLKIIDTRTVRTDSNVAQMGITVMAELQDLQDAVKSLTAIDGVVITELDKLVAKGTGISAADVAAAAATVKSEVAKLAAEVAKVDPPVVPPTPAPPAA